MIIAIDGKPLAAAPTLPTIDLAAALAGRAGKRP